MKKSTTYCEEMAQHSECTRHLLYLRNKQYVTHCFKESNGHGKGHTTK